MATESADARRPALRLTLREAAALLMPAARLDVAGLVAALPRGDGHAVLVLPALGRGDPYTADIRNLLTQLGYAAYGWELGVNIGPTGRLLDGAARRLASLAARHGPVSLLGFSLGGLFARYLAHRHSPQVRQVITVCSPIHRPADNFWLPLGPLLRLWRSRDLAALAAELAQPLPVPCTALYSREDGLVNWQACRDASLGRDEWVEIGGPHMLIARNPAMARIVADRLSRVQ